MRSLSCYETISRIGVKKWYIIQRYRLGSLSSMFANEKTSKLKHYFISLLSVLSLESENYQNDNKLIAYNATISSLLPGNFFPTPDHVAQQHRFCHSRLSPW